MWSLIHYEAKRPATFLSGTHVINNFWAIFSHYHNHSTTIRTEQGRRLCERSPNVFNARNVIRCGFHCKLISVFIFNAELSSSMCKRLAEIQLLVCTACRAIGEMGGVGGCVNDLMHIDVLKWWCRDSKISFDEEIEKIDVHHVHQIIYTSFSTGLPQLWGQTDWCSFRNRWFSLKMK